MIDDRTPDDETDDSKVTPLKPYQTKSAAGDGANDEALAIKLHGLMQEHADLDAAIGALETQPHHDRLSVARLKKKKLQLKDRIQAIKDQMTPDIIA